MEKNIEKNKERAGKGYSTAKGIVKRRKILTEYDTMNNCGEKCPRKYMQQFDKNHQIKLRNGYWRISTEEGKASYLYNLFESEEKKSITCRGKESRRRKYTFKYFMLD